MHPRQRRCISHLEHFFPKLSTTARRTYVTEEHEEQEHYHNLLYQTDVVQTSLSSVLTQSHFSFVIYHLAQRNIPFEDSPYTGLRIPLNQK